MNDTEEWWIHLNRYLSVFSVLLQLEATKRKEKYIQLFSLDESYMLQRSIATKDVIAIRPTLDRILDKIQSEAWVREVSGFEEVRDLLSNIPDEA